jgi:hypothetical protein
MNRITQSKEINPTSPFSLYYNYQFKVNIDLDKVPEEYRDFVFDTLLDDFKDELKSKIYNINKSILLK